MADIQDFRMRTITIEHKGYGISICKMRTTKGYSHITIQHKDNTITFDSSRSTNYEDEARELAKMIVEIADNPCSILEEMTDA